MAQNAKCANSDASAGRLGLDLGGGALGPGLRQTPEAGKPLQMAVQLPCVCQARASS